LFQIANISKLLFVTYKKHPSFDNQLLNPGLTALEIGLNKR